MTYINPFDLGAWQLEGLSMEEKSKLIVQDLLSNKEKVLNDQSIPITSSDFDQLIENLSEPNQLRYFEFLVNNQALDSFLKTGNKHFFNAFQDSAFYADKGFLEFVKPFFIPKFRHSYFEAFLGGDASSIIKMHGPSLLVLPKDRHLLYQPLEKYLHEIYLELSGIYSKLNRPLSAVERISIEELSAKILEHILPSCLNVLPYEFMSLRNNLAIIASDVALKIAETNPDQYEHCVQLANWSLQIKVKEHYQIGLEKNAQQLKSNIPLPEAVAPRTLSEEKLQTIPPPIPEKKGPPTLPETSGSKAVVYQPPPLPVEEKLAQPFVVKPPPLPDPVKMAIQSPTPLNNKTGHETSGGRKPPPLPVHQNTPSIGQEVDAMLAQLQAYHLGLNHPSRGASFFKMAINNAWDDQLIERIPEEDHPNRLRIADSLAHLAWLFWELKGDKEMYDFAIAKMQQITLDKHFVGPFNAIYGEIEPEIADDTSYEKIDELIAILPIIENRIKKASSNKWSELDPSVPIVLVKGLLDEDLQRGLVKISNQEVKRYVFEYLIPLFHFARRRNPTETLGLIDHLDTLIQSNESFKEKTRRVQKQVHEELNIVDSNISEGDFYSKDSQVPQEPVMLRLKKYFGDPEKGTDRIFKAISTTVAVVIALIIIIVSLRAIFGTYNTKEIGFYSKKAEILTEVQKEEKIPIYIEKQSLYVGHQLENGAQAFSPCFGNSEEELNAGNQFWLENKTEEDLVFVFYQADTFRTICHAYVQSGESYRLGSVPRGDYKIRFYVGKDWNPYKPNFCALHGAFDTNPHYLKLRNSEGLISFQGRGSSQYFRFDPINQPDKYISISASMFFYNREDVKPTMPDGSQIFR